MFYENTKTNFGKLLDTSMTSVSYGAYTHIGYTTYPLADQYGSVFPVFMENKGFLDPTKHAVTAFKFGSKQKEVFLPGIKIHLSDKVDTQMKQGSSSYAIIVPSVYGKALLKPKRHMPTLKKALILVTLLAIEGSNVSDDIRALKAEINLTVDGSVADGFANISELLYPVIVRGLTSFNKRAVIKIEQEQVVMKMVAKKQLIGCKEVVSTLQAKAAKLQQPASSQGPIVGVFDAEDDDDDSSDDK